MRRFFERPQVRRQSGGHFGVERGEFAGVRVTPSLYTTAGEVDTFVAETLRILGG